MISFQKEYELEFKVPLKIGLQAVERKRFAPFTIQVFGEKVTGEVSVLKGLNTEDFSNVKEEIKALKIKNDCQSIHLKEKGFGLLKNTNISNAALFAFESAILLHSIKNRNYECKINGLITNLESQKIPKYFSSCKIKIGRGKMEKEVESINQILHKSDITLRLDANRSFSKEELDLFWTQINEKERIEYIEEPYSKIEDLYSTEKIPLALDENLTECLRRGLPKNTKALIIKPSVHLSISGTISLINDYKKSDVSVIISSAFESPFAMRSLIYLSSLTKQDAGLDTLKYFKDYPENIVKTDQNALSF